MKRYGYYGVLAKGTKKTRALHYVINDRKHGTEVIRVRQIKKAKKLVKELNG